MIKKSLAHTILASLFLTTLLSCASSPKEKPTIPFEFIDANKQHHTASLDYSLKKHSYKNECFVREGEKLFYKGDDRYTSKLGIDISHHDGAVDWKKMKEWGIEFVILRTGYRGYQTGHLIQDKMFEKNIKEAIEAGLDIGVYFFSQAITEEEAEEEARMVLRLIEPHKKHITLPVVFDPESILKDEARTDGVPGEVFTRTSIIFCEAVKKAGYKPMIYSNMIWEAFFFNMEKLQDYEFWYADYEMYPQTPYAFTMWQYTDTAESVDGIRLDEKITKPVDLNIMIVKVEKDE